MSSIAKVVARNRRVGRNSRIADRRIGTVRVSE